MLSSIQHKPKKSSPLERFGVYYLNAFGRNELTHRLFDLTDAQIRERTNRITRRAIFLSAFTGIVLVWPGVFVDLWKRDQPWFIHYGWTAAATLASIMVEFYLLFLIALKAVHEVSELINIHAHKKDFLADGPFSITNILARTALELPDPEMLILGIDPLEKVSKKNLLILGLLYKLKIVLTNFCAKTLLGYSIGPTMLGISINYIAIPVEAFWNAAVIGRVVEEARLRLFGFALSNHIADVVLHDQLIKKLSPEARIGCIRAIGNAVVMARQYHPNIMVLLMRFQHLLDINEDRQYDSWELFLQTLHQVTPEERAFLLDLFTIAAAFDGKISSLEKNNIKSAYGEHYALYYPKLLALTDHIREGRLHAATDLCKIDFTAG